MASVATAWRAVHATTVFELRAIPLALATARERVWAAEPPVGPMIWDFRLHLGQRVLREGGRRRHV